MNTIKWRAVYKDGTYLDSKDAEKGYESIDRDQLASFCLVRVEGDSTGVEKKIKELEEERDSLDRESEYFQADYQKFERLLAKQRLLLIGLSIEKALATLFGRKEKKVFELKLQEGQRLIWRKRSIMTPSQGEQVWHLVGWQKTVNGENIQCIGYVSEEDGSVIMAGEWQGEHILLGGVELLDYETSNTQ